MLMLLTTPWVSSPSDYVFVLTGRETSCASENAGVR
jgi:hypothetical protein